MKILKNSVVEGLSSCCQLFLKRVLKKIFGETILQSHQTFCLQREARMILAVVAVLSMLLGKSSLFVLIDFCLERALFCPNCAFRTVSQYCLFVFLTLRFFLACFRGTRVMVFSVTSSDNPFVMTLLLRRWSHDILVVV